MANRYWIGGPGNWTTTGTTKWSAAAGIELLNASISGTALTTTGSPALTVGMTVYDVAGVSLGTIVSGSGNAWVVSIGGGPYGPETMTAGNIGASVPTTSDNVFFDAASGTGTVTLTGALACLSLDCTGSPTKTFSSTGTLNCAGNFTIVANITWSASGTITFSSTTTGRTITTNGRTLACSTTFNGVGGGWTLGGPLTIAGTITVTAGTFSSGGFAISCASVTISGSTTRTLNITNSTITSSSAWTATTTTNLTFTSTGSTINMTSAGNTFAGGGLTYNIVNFTNTTVQVFAINGANTFTTLTITNRSSAGVTFFVFGAGQTVTGTFTLASGGVASRRTMLLSNVVGTNRTITAATVSLGDVDFRNITGAGAASWTGTRLGDASSNSGITFDTPKNVYWNLAGSQSWLSNGWAATSGGSPAVANYPLPQDTAFIEGVGTAISIGSALNLPAIDLLTASSSVQLQFLVGSSIYGDLKLGTTNPSGTATLSFQNQDITSTITSNGRTLPCPIIIDCLGGTVDLADALATSNTFTLTSGTYSTANFAHTSTTVNISGTSTRTLSMGSGLFTLTGTGTVWNAATITGLTFNKDTANILLSDTSATARFFQGGTLTYNKLTIGGATGASTTSMQGACSFSELASTKTVAHTISFDANQTITTWSVTGTSGNVVTVNSSTVGTLRILTITNKTSGINYLNIKDIQSVNTAPVTFWAGANSTNAGNNKNIAFADGATTQAYILSSGTSFTTPVDWNNAANNIYLIGGGGGGSGGINGTGSVRSGGAGGGGGGFTLLTNQTISGAVAYTIGAGGTSGAGSATTSTGGTGGTTTWNTVNTATGGTGGAATTTTSTGGTGGTGTYTGGTGGTGAQYVGSLIVTGGGGGGSAGPNGNGGNGGNGNGGVANNDASAGGGGGNGGGTAGGNGVPGASGSGGNNSLGTGGGASVDQANGATGTLGGGGSGGESNGARGGLGGDGADILGGFGSGGGSGGAAGLANLTANPGIYGGGGGGGSSTAATQAGAAGVLGAIIIVYTISGPGPTNNGNFFFLFG